ncbi:uncharacterized protein LOC112556911 [Pomacea canaliculata]|uniref:uncharacterized protein LOC112556911 n=1 Tax=Pomacea canaliculata TaxID=400727 RepID=UPI000D73B6D1|nr:uncharacterized protein LOC112556911 [Pomacea canaliculata]
MAGVVVVTVVVAIVVVVKLRRKSDYKQDRASTRRGTKPDIPLEPPPTISHTAFDVVDNIYSKSRRGKSGDNCNEAGERNCEQPKIFTINNLVPPIPRDQQVFTPNEDYVDVASVKEPDYDDFVSSHVTGKLTK